MNPALLFLLVRTVRGRIVRALRLLRQPKYLIGLLAFVAWMATWMVGPIVGALRDGDDRDFQVEFVGDAIARIPAAAIDAVHVAAALLVVLLLTLWWLVPWARIALGLKESEIELLLSAPVRRRHFIQYATLKSQPGILFGSLMMTIFFGSGGLPTRLRWYLAFWLLFSVWDLHSKGRSLFKARLRELPRARATAWRAAVLLGLVIVWTVIVGQLDDVVAGVARMPLPDDGEQVPAYLSGIIETWGPRLQEGALRWVLAPFLWLTGPHIAVLRGQLGQDSSFFAALLMPLLLLVVHNEWVVRSQVKFEEAALEHARRELKKKDARARFWKSSLRARRRTPFDLPPRGRPELGVLWKNLLALGRFPLRTLLFGGAGVLALLALLPSFLGAPPWVNFLMLAAGGVVMMVWPMAAPQSTRCDLRLDLLQLEVVRSWPIPGWKLIAMEVAGPALVGASGSLFGAGLLLAGDVGARLSRLIAGGAATAISIATPGDFGAALGVPGFLVAPLIVLGALPLTFATAYLSAALQNLVVLTFPGWVHLGLEKQQGAAHFGQNLVVFLALSLALLLCFLPSALMIGLVVLAQLFLFGLPFVAWELPIFGLVAAVPPLLVAALAVRAGGHMWDALDPSREILDQAG